MKSRQGTAGRYAKALFSIAREGGNTEAVGRELEQFAAELAASPQLAAVLQRPWIKPGERQAVATEVATRAGCGTSVAFTADEKKQLVTRLGRALGKQVLVEETVDTSLLGGFVAQVGSLILDGSLDGQLARMRERLARG